MRAPTQSVDNESIFWGGALVSSYTILNTRDSLTGFWRLPDAKPSEQTTIEAANLTALQLGLQGFLHILVQDALQVALQVV